ncbi:ParB/RepB/Spo0J family partition protein [Streptomyces sp. NPDC002490]|uniref:ParB/RepB/Spo0J family partition protein n=1 Tax=Streptomyces sp. NPDC002490 TaxID=3154416 RepID=UPI00331F2C11
MSTLVEADSPRLGGESREHIELLLTSDAALPPILVHRQTMRVIDGMHRLRVAVLRGEPAIPARFFDGGDTDAFILAVSANVAHGLPLSLADRTAAAERIVTHSPHLSDRSIASFAGLSPKTVAAVRRRTNPDRPQLNARVGRDGRVRPVDSGDGRRRAARLIEEDPDTPLRDVAKAAGISLGTAHDVRERLRSGRDPVPAHGRQGCTGGGRAGHATPYRPAGPCPLGDLTPHPDRDATLRKLRQDPSLRFSGTGRLLLRLLGAQTLDKENVTKLIDNVPPHRVDAVAALALEFARAWHEFAVRLRSRIGDPL